MPAAPGFTPALVSVVGRPSRRAGITRASQGRPARRAGPFLPGLQKGPPNFFFRRMSPPFLLTLVSPPSAPAFTTLAHPRVGAGAGVTGVGAGSDMEGRGGRLGGGGGGESRDRRLAQTEKKKGRRETGKVLAVRPRDSQWGRGARAPPSSRQAGGRAGPAGPLGESGGVAGRVGCAGWSARGERGGPHTTVPSGPLAKFQEGAAAFASSLPPPRPGLAPPSSGAPSHTPTHHDGRHHPLHRPARPGARPVARVRGVFGPGRVPPARRRGGRARLVRAHRDPGAGGAVRVAR